MNEFSPHGFGLLGEQIKEKHSSRLGDEFLIPPFTVLNAREGWWQERKRAWLALGIRSELGRGEGVTFGESPEVTEKGLNFYRKKKSAVEVTQSEEEHPPLQSKPTGFLARRGYV